MNAIARSPDLLQRLADAEAAFLRNLVHFQDAAKSLIQQHNSQAGTEVVIG